MNKWETIETLLRQVMLEHSNPQSCNYRNCDTRACDWCSTAAQALLDYQLLVKEYLSGIGRAGGKKSKRTLTREDAIAMAKLSAQSRKTKPDQTSSS